MITAAEANAQAKESIDIDFEDRLEKVMADIQWASLSGRMKIQMYMPSQLMQEEIAKYLEKLGYLISYSNDDDSFKYENNGCYMYIYWGVIMFIKPCPNCGRNCKITEGVARNGHRFYMVGCPNFCCVLRPDPSDYWSSGFNSPRHTLHFNDDIDYNTMYKKWNEELI